MRHCLGYSIYWLARGQLENWVGSRLPKHLNNKRGEIVSCRCCSVFMSSGIFDCNNVVRFSRGHVLGAMGVTDDWYRECNETLSLVIAYGKRGRDGRALALSLRVVIAHCPNRVIRVTVREVQEGPLIFSCYEEYCERIRGRNGQGRA